MELPSSTIVLVRPPTKGRIKPRFGTRRSDSRTPFAPARPPAGRHMYIERLNCDISTGLNRQYCHNNGVELVNRREVAKEGSWWVSFHGRFDGSKVENPEFRAENFTLGRRFLNGSSRFGLKSLDSPWLECSSFSISVLNARSIRQKTGEIYAALLTQKLFSCCYNWNLECG